MPPLPSSQELRLLQAIAASPDDDAPALVYADWLMERGDPRGELIALACEALKLPYGNRKELLLSKCHDLKRRVPKPIERKGFEWMYRRGLPTGLWADSVSALLEVGTGLFEAAPLLEEICVTDSPSGAVQVRRLLHAKWFKRLRRLGWLHVGRGDSAGGFDDPAVGTLEGLHVIPAAEMRDSTPLYERLGRISHLCNLRELDLGLGSVQDSGLVALLSKHAFPALQKLDLAHNKIGALGCEAIVSRLPQVKSLQLYGNRSLGSGARRLAQLRDLEVLSVSSKMPDAGCRELAALPKLRKLSLCECKLTDRGALELLSLAGRLEQLDLDRNALSKATLRKLAQAFGERVRLPPPSRS